MVTAVLWPQNVRSTTFHDDGHDEAEHLFLRMIHLRVEVPARATRYKTSAPHIEKTNST